jgi:hypothetical protein
MALRRTDRLAAARCTGSLQPTVTARRGARSEHASLRRSQAGTAKWLLIVVLFASASAGCDDDTWGHDDGGNNYLAGPRCSKNADCGRGLACVDSGSGGECVPGGLYCTEDRDCTLSQVCYGMMPNKAGHCIPGCHSDVDCVEGWSCEVPLVPPMGTQAYCFEKPSDGGSGSGGTSG